MENKVLVLHPDDELKIINLQDRLISDLKKSISEEVKLLKIFPLWIPVDKTVSKKNIISVKAGPVYTRVITDDFINKRNFYLPFFIKTDEKEFQSDLLIMSEFQSDFQNISNFDSVSLQCRIFRTAIAHFENNRYFLTDSEWKKL